MSAGGVKVSVAFSDNALEPSPAWTDVTALRPNLVAGYSLERGREFEIDYTDTGQYTITIKDRDGILDPTNSGSALYGEIEPDLQMKVELWNPVTSEWSTRFRGWIEDYDYDLDPSQRIQQLTITGYDIFALLSLIEMQPGEFGDPPPGAPTARDGTIFFDNATFQDRIPAGADKRRRGGRLLCRLHRERQPARGRLRAGRHPHERDPGRVGCECLPRLVSSSSIDRCGILAGSLSVAMDDTSAFRPVLSGVAIFRGSTGVCTARRKPGCARSLTHGTMRFPA